MAAAKDLLTMRIFSAACVVPDAAADPIATGAVAVSNGLIAAVGPADEVRARFPDAPVHDLGDAILLPGFVNAHQHGRGLSQIQLGFPDDMLEPWIARRRGRGVPDAYALTRLAAAEMLRNGVTATLHANYSYGSGDYESELRGTIRAYDEAGIRATICIGYADRGGLVYPPADEQAFASALPAEARRLIGSALPAYLTLDETLSLMARLKAEYSGHPTITLAYGPAGPQWVSDEAWRVISADALRLGAGIHFHLLESPAQRRAVDALYPERVMTRLEALGVFRPAVSVAHFVHADRAEIQSAARLGVVVVANPGANMRLYNGAPPVGTWRAAGLSVALGTDNCALDDNEDYLSELRLGALLGRSPGPGRVLDESCRTLDMGTFQGARAAFLQNCGKILPGWKADLVAIDTSSARGAYLDPGVDLLTAVLSRSSGADVAMTMVNGQVLHEGRKSPGADTEEIRSAAARTAGESGLRRPGVEAAAEEITEALRTHYSR